LRRAINAYHSSVLPCAVCIQNSVPMEALVGAVGLAGIQSGMQALVGCTVVGAVLCHELPVKLAGLRANEVSLARCAKNCGRMLAHNVPEVLGLSTVLFLALLLRMRGDTEVLTTPVEVQAWEQIKTEWPILMCADTLLNLQAMLRLLVLLFLGLRADFGGTSPLSGSAAVFFCSSMVTRGILASRTGDYRLEGPLALGGDLPIACEAAMIPFLVGLGARALKSSPVSCATAVALATGLSRCHYLNFASNPEADSLFILAQLLELLAALAFLVSSITNYFEPKSTKKSPFVGFMQFLMPVQQALATYYWLTAVEPDPGVVGRGRPFCIIIMSSLLQLGAYLCSAALFFGDYFEVRSRDGHAPNAEERLREMPDLVVEAQRRLAA
jgi:hypothetical protein